MTAVLLVASLLVGGTLGMLGGGGSILLVPLLAGVGGLDPKQAIATSLVVVAVTSAVAAVPHARAGRVRWGTAGRFGAAGMVGAYVGGRVGVLLPDALLLGAFAIVMAVTAASMLRVTEVRPHGNVLVHGLVVGFATGVVGAGGGFLVVPALVLLGGLPMATAVGTSLVVIAMKSVAGLAGYLTGVPLDWSFAGSVALATTIGAVLGARLVGHVPADRLRRAFAWFVLALSVVVVAQATA